MNNICLNPIASSTGIRTVLSHIGKVTLRICGVAFIPAWMNVIMSRERIGP